MGKRKDGTSYTEYRYSVRSSDIQSLILKALVFMKDNDKSLTIRELSLVQVEIPTIHQVLNARASAYITKYQSKLDKLNAYMKEAEALKAFANNKGWDNENSIDNPRSARTDDADNPDTPGELHELVEAHAASSSRRDGNGKASV